MNVSFKTKVFKGIQQISNTVIHCIEENADRNWKRDHLKKKTFQGQLQPSTMFFD